MGVGHSPHGVILRKYCQTENTPLGNQNHSSDKKEGTCSGKRDGVGADRLRNPMTAPTVEPHVGSKVIVSVVVTLCRQKLFINQCILSALHNQSLPQGHSFWGLGDIATVGLAPWSRHMSIISKRVRSKVASRPRGRPFRGTRVFAKKKRIVGGK